MCLPSKTSAERAKAMADNTAGFNPATDAPKNAWQEKAVQDAKGKALAEDILKQQKSALPPALPDVTDEAVRQADQMRRRELMTARRSLTSSFVSGPSGRRSLLGGGL